MMLPRALTSLFCVALVAGVASFARQHGAQEGPQDGSGATIAARRGTWAADVLAGIGNDRPTRGPVAFLEAWHRAEGGDAAYNWLNTTQEAQGATDYNSVGVKNYPDYETGIQATVETLQNGYYPRTLAGLQGNAPVVDDAEMDKWGTGGGAIRRQLEATQPASVRADLVSYALSLQGIPYVRGGRSATGGDCSGTMQHIYLHVAGIDIGGTTFSQWPGLDAVEEAELQPGDLWYGQYSNDQHTGMVADVDGDSRWDLINNGGLLSDMHVDYDFLSLDYFSAHTMGFRRAL